MACIQKIVSGRDPPSVRRQMRRSFRPAKRLIVLVRPRKLSRSIEVVLRPRRTFHETNNAQGINIPPQWNAQGIDHRGSLRKSAQSVGQEPGLVRQSRNLETSTVLP